jgi:hypothetical protein
MRRFQLMMTSILALALLTSGLLGQEEKTTKRLSNKITLGR